MKKITKLYAIRLFVNTVLGKQIVIAREKFDTHNMAICVWADDKPRLKLPKQLDMKNDEIDKIFRQDFVERCPLARGFANITLSLLHECGHWKTRDVCHPVIYTLQVNNVDNQKDYMKIPYEHLATDWAIAWLQNPDNRRLAKFFERLYFHYGNDIEQ
jgi:hypothetical protein